ncbi:MAG: hypothetical protein KatS3mg031_2430 [Chitinophagales bacterium]|nr:MAG: hypothetical protein KatS3mg031_2430 [Chitinophagales bacterium]
MEPQEIIKKVRKIEIKTKGLSNHIFSGEYHTVFKGRGMSFSEVREYQFGDDIRAIDWNVTARFNHPFVKVFEEERELTVMLLVDVSRSAFFGTAGRFKNEMITEICAVLAFSAINNNDKVGVIFFSNTIEKFIPPKKGRFHILRIIRELINFPASGTGTNITEALRYLNNVMKKRSISFILSDFFAPDFQDALSIAHRRHDVVGIRIYDPLETRLPDVGLIRVKDAESGNLLWIDTASAKVRKHYQQHYEAVTEKCRQAFLKSGADLIHIRTDESYVNALIKFFRKRELRR